MRDIFIKLRVRCFVYCLSLRIFCSKLIGPFKFVILYLKRYLAIKKIDNESEDRWDRHVKIRRLEQKDELLLRREQFHILKTQLIGAFFRTTICSGSCVELQEHHNELDNSQKEFQENKEELVSLLEKLCDYDEITFDEKIKSGIINWEFGMFKTQEELNNWSENFSEYICTLDII